ncbi:MAG: hypothetical protein NC218_04250 [Acetobacter sp.]|nr:hypothetical protein [Acetobacter sp.]
MPDKFLHHRNLSVFIWVFIALNITFAYYQATFFWGNHDWDWIKGTTQVLSLDTGLFEGRYAKFILNVILFGGQVLPLLNTQVAFALLALGTTLLTEYWQIQKASSRLIVALMPALAPFILGWLYFPINILGNFATIPLVCSGLILAEKKALKYKIAAVICFLIALGVYPSVMEMIVVCWCAHNILIPQETLKKLIPSALTILLSLLMFKLLLTILSHANIIYSGHYNMQTATISEMLQRLPQTIIYAGKQLWITLPFFPEEFRVIGIGLLLIAIITSIRQPVNLLFWIVALGATILSIFLTAVPEEVAYMPRVNFYGVNYLYTAAAAVLLNQKGGWRNAGLTLSLLFIFISINQNFYAQKVWHFGKIAEEKLAERLNGRVEEKAAQFPLTPIIAGELPLRSRYYKEKYQYASPYILNTAFIVRHIPSGMLNFYMPHPLFTPNAQITEISPELYRYLKNAIYSYPAEESIYVDDVYAIFLLTKEGIKAIQAQLP